MQPSALATTGIGYFRLHGRDAGYWRREFSGCGGEDDYLYAPAELDLWAERIRHVRAYAQHFRGSGQSGRRKIGGERAAAQPSSE